ncbi:unnamed protein product [Cladocopium goreaui]|uniref:Dickkopf N-terminal cysteine-rich domain-containing protein n=1 Tax=Cladocopium goreaui TaxID=2562237 RepID=A0A9P1GME0_9DINO|nr:unnamed protein product [Cladocopium goreaui]
MSLEAGSSSRPRGKDRWNLLRDVHSITKQVRGTSSPIPELSKSVVLSGTPAKTTLEVAPQEALAAKPCSPPSLISPALSEPAPEPGVEGESALPEKELHAASKDVQGEGGQGEDFSDLSEASDGEEKSASLLAAVPIVQVHDKTQDEENSIESSKLLSGREPIKSQTSEKRELQVPSSLLNGSKSARVRLSERRSGSRRPQNRPAAFGETTAATRTDMVASMVSSLAGLASFKFTTENADSEGEVHNAWGDNDTEDNLLERVQDLEQARGIALGPPQSSARMRRARKNKKDRPKEAAARSSQDGASQQLDKVRPQHTESNSDTFTAASSMVTTMFNSFGASVSFTVNVKQDAERESGTKSHATEESAASTAEPPKTCLAVPMSQPPSAGRDRFARRRNRLDPPLSACSNDRQSSLASASQGTESQLSVLSDTSSRGRQRERRKQHVSEEGALTSRSTLFDVAASSLAEFQRLFQSDEGETYCIWGPDDTPEQYQERLKALDASQEPASQTSGTMLHHRLMRRRKKKQEALERKNQETADATGDPFLLT